MPEPKRPLKVFLCHASQDKPIVRELSRRLASEGWIDPWVDEKKLLPGQDWRTKIEEAVETSDIVIICLSSNSVTKEGYVQKELRYAREIALEKPEETIFLVPLRLDECDVPRGLRFYQWVDYFGEKKDESFGALIESLKLRYEQKLRIEEEERAHKEKEKQERKAAENAAREKAEREAAEKVAREQAEQEAADKAKLEVVERIAREQAEREALKKAVKEQEKREAAEKVAQEKAKKELERGAKKVAAGVRATERKIFWSNIRNRLNLIFNDVRYYFLPVLFALIVIAGVAYLIFYAPKNFPKLIQTPTSTSTTVVTQPPLPTFTAFPPSETPLPSITPTQTEIETSTPSAPFTYTVQENDTLGGIATKFNLGNNGILLILQINPGIDPATQIIHVGDQILIPNPGMQLFTSTPIPANLRSGTKVPYTVETGDTLAGIASKFNSTADAIVTANKLTDANSLMVGQLLQIPVNIVTPIATRLPTSTPVH